MVIQNGIDSCHNKVLYLICRQEIANMKDIPVVAFSLSVRSAQQLQQSQGLDIVLKQLYWLLLL